MTVHRNAAVLLLILALTLVYACRRDDTGAVITGKSSVSSSNVAGWNKVSGADYEVLLPAEYTIVDLTAGDFEQVWNTMKRDNPNLASMEAEVRQAKSTGIVRFLARAQTGATATSVNLVVEQLSPQMTTEQYDAHLRQGLQTMAVPGSYSERTVSVAGKEFLFAKYQISVQGTRIALLACRHIAGQRAYIVTFGANSTETMDIEAFAQDVVATLRTK
jgi:hypothetical protein